MTDEEEKQLTLLAIRKLPEVRLELLNATEARIMAQARLDFLNAKVETYKCLVEEAKFEEQILKGDSPDEEPVNMLVLIPDGPLHGPDPA